MKTPSPLLLLALAAALPYVASADVPTAAAGSRCKTDRLTKLSQGYVSAEDEGYLKTETEAGVGTRKSIDIGKMPDLCDATVWRYLVYKGPADGNFVMKPGSKEPVGGLAVFWRDESLKAAWAGDIGQQAKILLTVDDVYKVVDAQGRDILADGDAVVDAAVKIGVAARKDAGDTSGLATTGAAHAKFAGQKGYTVEAVASKAVIPPADIAAALPRLLADPPAPKAPKAEAGKPAPKAAPAGEPILGPAVLEFRKAVIGLASNLAVMQATRNLASARGVDSRMKADFTPGPGAMYAAAAKLAGKDGKASFPDSVALSEPSYRGALKYLTDPAITSASDDSTHEGAALSRLDYALRNLIALRAAAVDQAVAAAKASIKGHSVKEIAAGAAHQEKAAGDPAKPAAPPNELAAQVVASLQKTQEYADLKLLFDNNKDNATGVAAKAQMDKMTADAAATGIVKTDKGSALQYSVGGAKVTDTGILVADLKSDKDYRDFIAGAVATNIATDGKVQAVIAALKGAGASGTPVAPPLKPAEQATAGDLPPVAVPAPAKPAEKTLTPWEALAKATPSGWFWSSKETAERYAAHENEAAADAADAASRERASKERALNWQASQADRAAKMNEDQKVIAAAGKARADIAAIHKAPQDPDLSKEEADRLVGEQVAAREKAAAAEAAAIRKATADAKAARDAAAAAALKEAQAKEAAALAAKTAKLKALDETVDKAYTDGIARSETNLHGAYKKPGDDRRNAAEKASGYSGPYYRTERVDKYFTDVWEGDKLAGRTAWCKTKLGFKMPVGTGEDFKDPSVDNVDGLCEVRNGLVGLLNSYRGSVKAPVAAPAGK